MNLILDFGNTATKIIIIDNYQTILSEKFYYKNDNSIDVEIIKNICANFPEIRKIIISSVIELPASLFSFLKTYTVPFILLDENTKLPVQIKYKTPQTLGKDRIAAVVGANWLCPENNCLVIDIGTAITFDFITNSAEFIGGNISPGANTRFKALNTFTKKLPLITETQIFNNVNFGSSTHEAISFGVLNGIFFEMTGYIHYFEENYTNTKIFLTGGDANLFAEQLKNSIFAEPNLVAIGLNRILEYNE